MPSVEREYKDRLFSFIFGNEDHKDWTLSLYNAVNNSDYSDPSSLTLTTIKEALYLGMHNDVSFLISNEMNLYEQQASFNPNMPLRLLQYAGNMYEKYIKQNKLNKYSSSLIKLPTPKLVVFYNGKADKQDEIILKLSDAYITDTTPDIEVSVRMLNINYGKNKALIDSCEPLQEYVLLIHYINVNRDIMDIELAVNTAIDSLPKDSVIKPFLEAHRAEVSQMLLAEYNETEAMELFRAEGRKEGRAEGRKEGRAEGRKEGRAEGMSEGIDSMAALMKYLFSLGRIEDAQKAAENPVYRDKLLKEFKML